MISQLPYLHVHRYIFEIKFFTFETSVELLLTPIILESHLCTYTVTSTYYFKQYYIKYTAILYKNHKRLTQFKYHINYSY